MAAPVVNKALARLKERKAKAPPPQRASALPATRRIPTGCSALDDILRGGVQRGIVSEVCGEAGSGKSHFCLQTMVMAVAGASTSSKPPAAVYITTEHHVATERLHDIARALGRDESLCDDIFIIKVSSSSELQTALRRDVPRLQYARRIQAIAIDSITALFRGADSQGRTTSQSEEVLSIGARCRLMASAWNAAVVIANQVSDVMDHEVGLGAIASTKRVVPALGVAWASAVHVRIFLRQAAVDAPAPPVGALSASHRKLHASLRDLHTEGIADGQHVDTDYPRGQRSATVIFSPSLPRRCAAFSLAKAGIVDV